MCCLETPYACSGRGAQQQKRKKREEEKKKKKTSRREKDLSPQSSVTFIYIRWTDSSRHHTEGTAGWHIRASKSPVPSTLDPRRHLSQKNLKVFFKNYEIFLKWQLQMRKEETEVRIGWSRTYSERARSLPLFVLFGGWGTLASRDTPLLYSARARGGKRRRA